MSDEHTATDEQPDHFRWNVEQSIRYHEMRRSFFARIDFSIKLAVIIFGSAGASTFMASIVSSSATLASPTTSGSNLLGLLGAAFALSSTIVGAFDLTIGAAAREKEHAYLSKGFVELLKKFRTSVRSERVEKELIEEYHDIIASEPAKYRAVSLIARNQVILGRVTFEVHHLTDYRVSDGPDLQSPQR